MRIIAIPLLLMPVACWQGGSATSPPSPVDVDFAQSDIPAKWKAWSYEPGIVTGAAAVLEPPYVLRAGDPVATGRGSMIASSPLVTMPLAADGYIDVDGDLYTGGAATYADRRDRLRVVQGGQAMAETLRTPDAGKVVITIWPQPGQPSWSKTATPAPYAIGAALSPDGRLAVIAKTNVDELIELALYDADSGAERWSLRTGIKAAGRSWVSLPLAFSADGRHIVFGGYAQRESITQVRGLGGELVANVSRATPPEARNERGFGFTFGLSSNCLWISSVYYSAQSDSSRNGTNSWHCDFEVFDVQRNRRVADTGPYPRGDAFRRRIFDSEPDTDCPARLVVADGPGLSVVSYQPGPPGHVRVRTFPTIPGCK